jgi:hypothetical protein
LFYEQYNGVLTMPKFIIIDLDDYFSDAHINAGYVNFFTYQWDQKPSSREIALLEKIKKIRDNRSRFKLERK